MEVEVYQKIKQHVFQLSQLMLSHSKDRAQIAPRKKRDWEEVREVTSSLKVLQETDPWIWGIRSGRAERLEDTQ